MTDENSFDLNQQFIDDYQPIRPSRNPIVREELEQPPSDIEELSDEQEEALLVESETITTTLSIPGGQIKIPKTSIQFSVRLSQDSYL